MSERADLNRPLEAASSAPVCRLCGETIGVYEPLVAVEAAGVRKTSRASEPAISQTPGEYWHAECYERRDEEIQRFRRRRASALPAQDHPDSEAAKSA